jgi:hypothetical protein
VRTVESAPVHSLPTPLAQFMRETCGLRVDAFRPVTPAGVAEPERSLLCHGVDMTSTLANFHGGPLRVEVLRTGRRPGLYLREVFLRTQAENRIVEYGVISIALDQFSPPQQEAVLAGQVPLGELLHRFAVSFVSAPIGFFSVTGAVLAGSPLAVPAATTCFGRFNCLSRSSGEPLAWILEILPPLTSA